MTNAPEGNLSPKHPRGYPTQGSRENKAGTVKSRFYHTPKPGKELQVSPLRKRKGEHRAQEECVAAWICDLGANKTQSQLDKEPEASLGYLRPSQNQNQTQSDEKKWLSGKLRGL